ncbi:ThuA domain-containing protein [Agromyces sp. NPDC055658]
MTRNVLVVRGGWEGHHPVETTDLFLPFLQGQGFEVTIEDDPEVYADAERMAAVDLVLQSVTMSHASGGAVTGLRDAVAAGAGFAGWHGGITDSFRASSDYLQLVGGQFVAHPSKHPDARRDDGRDGFLEHTIDITDLGRAHEIMVGLDDFALDTEQYWVLHDDLNDVLATTTHPVQSHQPWHRPLTCPAVWTRYWGNGRVFVATPGHDIEALQDTNVKTIIERGMLWAARTA